MRRSGAHFLLRATRARDYKYILTKFAIGSYNYSMDKNAAILDIGSGKLVFALGRRSRRGIYTIDAYASIRYSGYYRAQWVEEDKLAENIGRAIAQSGCRERIRTLYVGVPADFIRLENNSFLMNFEKERVISDAILDKIHAHADRFPPERGYRLTSSAVTEYILDSGEHTLYPLGMRAGGIRANLSYVLTRSDFCETIERAVAAAGIESVRFISQDWAVGKQLLDDSVRTDGAFVADVGFVSSSFSFVKGDGLDYLISAPIGGGCIADDLSYAMEIEFEDALAFLPRVNLNRELTPDDLYEVNAAGETLRFGAREVNRGIQERLNQIASFIKKGLENAYAQGLRGAQRDSKLYMSGGGIVSIRGAIAYLERIIGRQIVLISADVPQYGSPRDASAMALLNVAADLKGSETILGKIFG